MIYSSKPSAFIGLLLLVCCCWRSPVQVTCKQQQPQQQQQQQSVLEYQNNFPYYMASPMADLEPQNPEVSQISQRTVKQAQKMIQPGRKPLNNIDREMPQAIENPPMAAKPLPPPPPPPQPQPQQQQPQQQQQQQQQQLPPKDTCLYGKRYFMKLDECLARKPYPTMGMLAFKNEDLVEGGSSNEHNKHGCVFVLNNGLFKNYQISRYSVQSDLDEQCLDNSRVSLSMMFSNVTLAYLWTLRCLNRADQMLDDATMLGRTVDSASVAGEGQADNQQASSICVGSSQNFGFASLQLTNLEAQVDLVTDIYKNWRVTNVTVSMVNPGQVMPVSTARGAAYTGAANAAAEYSNPADSAGPETSALFGTNIKDFVFESLDGDELNWRYLHLFQNWSRNRMHANFLAQYKRFLWISLQRCLMESSEKLPTKLMDIFTNQKFS